ncbi:two-component sensor histidine kinase [Flavobacterium album]|uniref:histidine kinase n=1 Tax=Flavobacterium album TaxID=2175091 RepID=A0A2S1QWH1_9FLAO|nr:HAMP domain-containing sensor histidine kinase [Flavobacterium album]AWH84756.1 two-component sensor histidine kinase [Flavobacterium album]
MQITDKRAVTRWFIIIASFLIVVLIVWNTYFMFQTFKDEERNKMKLWVQSQEAVNRADENTDVTLPQTIIESNNTIPILLVQKNEGKDVIVANRNLPEEIARDTTALRKMFEKIKEENTPIAMRGAFDSMQYIYYGNSTLLNQLKYYPIALVLIIVLFGAVVYNFYRATKMSSQNRLWAGMAKETAHQIGTPLSSLLGWIEIMKADNVDETTIEEIEKDVNRLQTIAERFSKIGSEPLLEERDIVAETENAFDYLRARASSQVEFNFRSPNHPVMVMLNPELHSWTIENLVKNAIDAMKGKGRLDIVVDEREKFVKVKVSDTGKGIPKSQFSKVFEPGFTTKKRGWGLGLSLTKRIVEEYHKGKIKVLNSEVGKGTTMQASYKRV